MSKRWEENFNALLAWLHEDRELAGQKYEDIRQSLINIFSWRGCHDAEDLADEAITRVMNKVDEIASGYFGDPALYFYGVAKKMIWEIVRRERVPTIPVEDLKDSVPVSDPIDREPEYECLERCLAKLPAAERQLILLYYQQERPKINYRRELARKLGMAPNNLRVKVHRIRTVLYSCIEECLREKAKNETN